MGNQNKYWSVGEYEFLKAESGFDLFKCCMRRIEMSSNICKMNFLNPRLLKLRGAAESKFSLFVEAH